ncbi:MAG: ABC transporter permease [Elstera sp.]
MTETLQTLLFVLLNGLVSGGVLFLIASGLTLIFGVCRVVNFAHGSLAMLGAFLTYSLLAYVPYPLAILGAVLTVALLGAGIERSVIRPLNRAPELFQLLATFALVLIIQDAALAIWGPEDLLGPRWPSLSGSITLLERRYPIYNLFLIAIAALVAFGLHRLMTRTRFGILIRAATLDAPMLGALGVREDHLRTAVFALGAGLAGLGGALLLPRDAAHLGLDLTLVVDAFVVVVVGGLGSVGGAFRAAFLIGLVQSAALVIWPKSSLVLPFLIMALTLWLRPQGLGGKPPPPPGPPPLAERAPPLKLWTLWQKQALALGLLALATAPLWLGLLPGSPRAYGLLLLTEILCLGLFALSLHWLIGVGGLVTFGQAAFFGLGAYGLALTLPLARLDLPEGGALALGLGAATLIGGLGGLGVGALAVRLSGVSLAMVSLAVAQGLWSLAIQAKDWTGGDDGLLGLTPRGIFADRAAFFLLVLALAVATGLLLRRLSFAPTGAFLRAFRDHPGRAAASGLSMTTIKLRAFALSGAIAGLAGGLTVLTRGSAFPQLASLSQSVDGLVMLVLGGQFSLLGAFGGAAVFHTLHSELIRSTPYWRAVLGAALLALIFGRLALKSGRLRWFGR